MSDHRVAISVIIPAYNAQRYLAVAVESVLQQTLAPQEIIVIDDGSIDDSAAVTAGFSGKIRTFRQQNSGPSAARNRGLELSNGDYISFLDADDWYAKEKLQVQFNYLLENPAIEIIMGRTQYIRLADAVAGASRFEAFGEPRAALHLGSALFKRSVFDRVGLFDVTLRHGEDVDWFLRAREQGITPSLSKETALFYRIHESNMSRDKMARDFYFMKALKKSLDRRRQQPGDL